MHILIIPSWYQPEQAGHLGVFVRDLARAYAEEGHEVRVLSLVCGDRDEEIVDGKITELYHPSLQHGPVWKKIAIPARSRSVLDRYTMRFGMPDIINTHGLIAIRFVSRWAHARNIPVVHSEHLGILMSERAPLKLRWLARHYYKRVSAIIAVSTAHAEGIGRWTKTRIYRIPGMVQDEFFRIPLERNLRHGFHLVCVSDLDQGKGHDLLLRALGYIAGRDLEFTCHLVGDGPLRQELEDTCRQERLRDKVIFHGRLGRAGVRQVLSQCHLYCTATELESFGLHIAEALAAGLYVITTDCGSVHDYINAENGIIVRERNPEQLADAIEMAMVELNLDAGPSIRASIESYSSQKVVIPRILEIFRSVLDR